MLFRSVELLSDPRVINLVADLADRRIERINRDQPDRRVNRAVADRRDISQSVALSILQAKILQLRLYSDSELSQGIHRLAPSRIDP